MFTRFPLITWERFAIPEKCPFDKEETVFRGRRARREPLSGAASCANARDGSRWGRGGDSIRRCDLLSTWFPPICFLPGNYFFRRPRERIVVPPEPGDLLTTIYRQNGEKLYRFEWIDNAGDDRRECFPARRWGSSSAGRAPRSQRGGRGFNPLLLHHLSLPHYKHAPGD